MALVPDIVASWRRPAEGVRRHLARPRSEAFIFTFLFVFLLVAFVAQWPVAARASYLQPEVPMTQRLLAMALAMAATVPFWYGLAAVSRLVARALGGQGDWYRARLALFWALAVVSPAMLLQGLAAGMLGGGRQAELLGLAVAAAFLWLWLSMLAEAERRR